MAEPQHLGSGDALILVDVQQDFCPGGALPIEQGYSVIPVLNRWIEQAVQADVPVFASRDWHPKDHLSFTASGGPWPAHCIQGTKGAAFHADLRLPADVITITKGHHAHKDQYSAFDETDLADALRQRGIKRVWIGGLAQDVCVRATALDAVRAGFETHVIAEATRPVTEEGGREALADMRQAGVSIE